MIRQSLKDLYFGLTRYLLLPATWLARWKHRRPPVEGYRLHLGCGTHRLAGMINIDGNILRRCDLWLDLRNRLPFPDQSASLIYCSHTIEHLFPDDALHLLREMRRVLRDDGVVRLAVPSMEHALAIAQGQASMAFPREFDDPMAQAVNYLFCDGQHKYGYCWGLMRQFAQQAGFGDVRNISEISGVAPMNYGPLTLGAEPAGSLVVELRRNPPVA